MHYKKIIFAIIVFTAIIIYSCKNVTNNKIINEGILKYKITYIEDENTNPLIGLLPKELEYKFKGNKTLSKVEGWMGVFSTIFITDVDSGINHTLLKLMGHKYAYRSNIGETLPGVKKFVNPKVKFLSKTKNILGYKCKEALIFFPDSSSSSIIVYYSDEFGINNSHFSENIFKTIPGILVKFPMEMNGISMKLELIEVIPCTIPDEEFIVPHNYESISKDKMQEVIDEII